MPEVPSVLFAEHRNEVIGGPRFVLDGGWFENCKFVDALLIYGGGPCMLRGCSYERCRVWIHGPARWTIEIQPELDKILDSESPPPGAPLVS